MYKIIGGDGKEYGPISADQLRQWITQGRVNADTQIQVEGTSVWVPLSRVPGFSPGLSRPAGLPPVPDIPLEPKKTSGMAIASLVLGILGVFTCGITAVIGLVLGIIAQVRISNPKSRLSGSGMAIAGICVSAISLFILPGLLLPALAKAKEKAMTINCVNNMKQLGLYMVMYADEHGDRLPAAAAWSDSVSNSVASARVFHCPADSHPGCSYAFNQKLDRQNIKQINRGTVMLFESTAGWNASGGPELMDSSRHGHRVCNVVFADGSVRTVRTDQLSTLRWDP